MSKELVEKTKKTAELNFKGVQDERPFDLWKAFDKDLAKDLSLFITGQMYAREKIPHPTRQLVTVACLTVLSRPDELKLHIQAALNVGCTPAEIAEVIFQTIVYGGVPAANQALKTLKAVLLEKGLWNDQLFFCQTDRALPCAGRSHRTNLRDRHISLAEEDNLALVQAGKVARKVHFGLVYVDLNHGHIVDHKYDQVKLGLDIRTMDGLVLSRKENESISDSG